MQPGFNQPPPNADAAAGVFVVFAVLYGAYILSLLVSVVLFIITLVALMNNLNEVNPRNRQMEPGMVWLCLVPFLNIVWIFLTVIRVAGSLRDEYEDRDLRGDDDYGQTLGLVYAILAITVVCGCLAPIPLFMYRQKIVGYTRELEDSPAPRSRRRPRRDRDDEPDDDRDDDR